MKAHRGKLVLLPANRVWRTYLGGRTLDALGGAPAPADGHFPEDWIASTTRAINAGREGVDEGISRVLVGGRTHPFADLLKSDPEYFLGTAHVARHGANLRLLVKFLDPSIRLHFQVHPTAAFARQFLSSPSGKTEAYHVLATRPEIAEPYLYLGFQRPPSRDAMQRMIERQDIAAIEACFEKVPVKPGDTFVVPGGVPHALGEGIFLVEIQEPSDLVVRFEFERGGHVLPESARFMNRGLPFCLDIFDMTPRPLESVLKNQRCLPRLIRSFGPETWMDQLIGPEHTSCFSVDKLHLSEVVNLTDDRPAIHIVTSGACTIESGGDSQSLQSHDKFFAPAGIGPLKITPQGRTEILICRPPAP